MSFRRVQGHSRDLESARPSAPPLRVLIVGPSMSILGGQAIQAQRLIEHLRRDPSVTVDFLPVNPQLPAPVRWLQTVKYVRTVVTSVCYWADLVRRVRRFDLVHVLSASYWSFLLAPTPALAVAKLYGKPTLLNYRSGEARDHLTRSAVARRLIAMYDDIVVGSPYLVGVFAQFGLEAHAIPNIVNLDRLRFRRRVPLRPRFLSNRNLEPLYNVTCTVRAYQVIALTYPDATLDIVGDGSERRQLETLVRTLGVPNVTFHGQVSADVMADLYDRADIFLNSSDIDNMPTSLLEAQACGLPVVTTDAGGISFIVEDGKSGLMVRRGDHEALAGAALRYLSDPWLVASVTDQGRLAAAAHRGEAARAAWVATYQTLAGHCR